MSLSLRLGSLLFAGLLAGCGPDDSANPPGTGGSGGSSPGGSSSAGNSGSVGHAGAAAGGGGAGADSSNAGSPATGGVAGSTGSGGALTGQAWKDFMFESYCPAACDKTMELPCYMGGATSTDCLNECYAYWTNAFMVCPAAVPPLTQCGYPNKVSYACADGMVSESFGADCSDEADAVSDCN